MKFIITGGAGFIGSHLSKRLISEKNDIIIIDNLHDYYSIDRKKKQLEYVQKSGFLLFKQFNLLDYDKVLASFQEFSPDVVIHLAALPGVSYSILHPLDYVDYDIKATINILKASGEAGAGHVIFASSSSVYGNIENQLLTENMAKGKVISPYAAAKYSAEAFCHTYESLYGYQMSILRFFTVYGPWGRPDMAITKFIKKLIYNEEITVYGTGTSRDYTYIEDIIDGIIAVINFSKKSNIFNIGSSSPIDIEDLVQILHTYFPAMKVRYGPYRKGDVTSTWADITKARSLLGYNPNWTFKQGIAKTVQWAKENEQFL